MRHLALIDPKSLRKDAIRGTEVVRQENEAGAESFLADFVEFSASKFNKLMTDIPDVVMAT